MSDIDKILKIGDEVIGGEDPRGVRPADAPLPIAANIATQTGLATRDLPSQALSSQASQALPSQPSQFTKTPQTPKTSQALQALQANQDDITALQNIADEFDPDAKTIGSAFARGLQQGLEQFIALPRTLRAVFTKDKEELARITGELSVAPSPDISNVEDIDSFGAFMRYAAGLLGSQVPVFASIAAGGGAGAAIGRAMASRIVARNVAEGLAKRAAAVAAAQGATAGVTATASAIEGASTAQEIFAATGEIRPIETVIAGIAKGALESITPIAIAKRFGILADDASSIISKAVSKLDEISNPVARRIVSTAGVTLTEGTTELAQEAIDIATREYVDENFDILSPQTASRLLNAFAGGAVVGAIFGGAGETAQALQEKISKGLVPDRTEVEDGALPPQTKVTNDPDKPLAIKVGDRYFVGDVNLIAAIREFQDPNSPVFEVDPEAVNLDEIGQTVKAPVASPPDDILKTSSLFVQGVVPEQIRAIVNGQIDNGTIPLALKAVDAQALEGSPALVEIQRISPRTSFQSSVSDIAKRNDLDEAGLTTRLTVPDFTRVVLDILVNASESGELDKLKELGDPTDPKNAEEFKKSTVRQELAAFIRTRLGQDPNEPVDPNDSSFDLADEILKGAVGKISLGSAITQASSFLASFAPELNPISFDVDVDNISKSIALVERIAPHRVPQSVAPFDVILTKDGREALQKSDIPAVTFEKKLKLFSKAAKKALNILKKNFPDLRLTILIDPAGGSASGAAFPARDPFIIKVSPRTVFRPKTKGEEISTLVHEIGHIIMYHLVMKNKGELLSLLREEYANFVIRATFTSKSRELVPIEFVEPILPTFKNPAVVRSDYFTSFTEWFARQFSRWAFSRPETIGDEVFSRLAKKVRRLIEKIAPTFDLDPGDTFDSFIKKLPEELNFRPLLENSYKLESPDTTADIFHAIQNLELGKSKDPIDKELEEMAKKGLEAADFYNKLVKWGFTIEQLAIKNPHIEPLQRYVQLLDGWAVLRSRWLARATETLRNISYLSSKQLKALSDLTFAMDEMVYLSGEEKLNGVARWPRDEEFARLLKKYKVDEATLQVYNRIVNDFMDVLDFMERIAIQNAEQTIADEELLQQEIQKINDDFNRMRSRPYFPHTRFGKFIVTVRNSSGRIIFSEQTETERQAKKLKAELEKVAGPEDAISIGKLPEELVPFMGLPAPFLNMIRGELDLTPEQLEQLEELIVSLSPERSFRRRFLQRKNVAGYSRDLPRVYAQYFLSAANFMARIAYKDQLQRAVADLRGTAAAIRRAGGNSVKRDGIADFVQDHLNNLFNPAKDWAALRSLAAVWYLGFNAKAAFVNFTQIPLVAWPYLSARFKGATKALKNAVKELKLLYIDPEKFVKALKPIDQKMFEEAFRQNFIDESIATELAQVAEASTLARLGGATKVQRMLSGFNAIAMAFFQTSEKINRRIVFKAGYDLALKNPDAPFLQELKEIRSLEFERLVKKGFSEQEALAFLAGKDAVVRTQFKYSKENRPRFMRGKAGTVFTFFMFTQNMLFTLFNSPGNMRMFLVLLFTAGLMGLPGAEDINDIVKFIGRKLFGKNFDPKLELKRVLLSIFGTDSELPDFILHGAARNSFGLPHIADMMGIPLPSVDLSSSISFGRVVPGVQAITSEGDDDARFSRAMTDMAGAAFGIGINIYKALTDSRLSIDDYKRWERAMPRALANISKAARFRVEGRERNRAGATILEFDPNDPKDMLEVAAQAFGFTPTRLTRRYDRDFAIREATLFWNNRRSILMLQMMHALDSKDATAISDAKRAIVRFNKSVPFRSLAINTEQLIASIKNRLRARALEERGIPNAKIMVPVARDIQELFPEIKRDESRRR